MTQNTRYDRAQRMEPRADSRRKGASYHLSMADQLKSQVRKVFSKATRLLIGKSRPGLAALNPDTNGMFVEPHHTGLIATLCVSNPGFNSHLV